jgi:hypothetical protein
MKLQLKSIQARAKSAAAKLNSKDANSVKQTNAALSGVRADLVAYAKANGLKLRTHTNQSEGIAEESQSCLEFKKSGNMNCYLTGAEVRDGTLFCIYSCVETIPPKKK